ncbi:GvpL/GvpF family gas vesicle protein [Frigoriglobus tundricola]|uniref:GvpL/GvpF family gas vesicle protein n=1 Tax=Frigoriglobus tundricola TaxID=2774151 RepID=UPI0036F389ED
MRVERVGDPVPGIAAHALIARETVATFRAALAAHPILGPLQWVVTGPWPPFNFAGAPPRDGPR